MFDSGIISPILGISLFGIVLFFTGIVQVIGIRLVILLTLDKRDNALACVVMGGSSWWWGILTSVIVTIMSSLLFLVILKGLFGIEFSTGYKNLENPEENWALIGDNNNNKAKKHLDTDFVPFAPE